jgi:hypothetical protein
MRNIQEVQLAWHLVELLETLSDLIWELYQEDFRNDITEHEHLNENQPSQY